MPTKKTSKSQARRVSFLVAPTRRRRAPASGWQVPTHRAIELQADAAANFAAIVKLRRIIESLSLSAAADILGIDRSQLDRCRKGKEAMSAEVTRRIVDVEYLLDRALRVMHADEIGPWLTQPEALLGGSVPLNVLILKGAGAVVAALDGIAAGAFA